MPAGHVTMDGLQSLVGLRCNSGWHSLSESLTSRNMNKLPFSSIFSILGYSVITDAVIHRKGWDCRADMLKVSSWDQEHQHHLRAYSKCKFSGLTPIWFRFPWAWAQESVFKNFQGDAYKCLFEMQFCTGSLTLHLRIFKKLSYLALNKILLLLSHERLSNLSGTMDSASIIHTSLNSGGGNLN